MAGLTLGLIGLMAAATGFVVHRDHAMTEAAAIAENGNLAAALARYTQELMVGTDQALSAIVATVRFQDQDDPIERSRMFALLSDHQKLATGVLAFFIVDRTGRVQHSSRTEHPDPVDLANHEFMAAARDAVGARASVSAPYVGDVGHARGRPIVVISRPIRRSDGSLWGVVAAALSVEQLSRLYGAVDIAGRKTIALFRDDGTLLVAHPFDASRAGTGLPVPPPSSGDATMDGQYRAVGPDGTEVLVSRRRVSADYPLVTAVGTRADDEFREWRVRTALLVGTTLVLGLLAVGTGLYAGRLLARRAQAAAEQSRRLALLASASADLSQAPALSDLLRVAADAVRELIGCHQSVTSRTLGPDLAQQIHAVSLSEKYAAWRSYDEAPDGSGIYALVCCTNQPIRLTQAELEAHPAWRGFGAAVDRHPPMRGWLAVPLVSRDGANIGLIQLSDRYVGDFTADDESVCRELAHVASIAIENLQGADSLRQSVVEATEARAAVESNRLQTDRARRRIETILESISDAFYVLDPDFRFGYLNGPARAVLGDGLIGKVVWAVLPEIVGTPLATAFRRGMETKEPVALEFRQGGMWLDIRIHPFEDGLSVYFHDVTERHEAETKLRQAQRLEAVGQLTGGIAHDFNNLLTVMLGLGDEILARESVDQTTRHHVETIVRAAERATQLTNSLLAFSRRQTLEPKSTDIRALLDRLERLLRRAVGEAIDMGVAISGTPAPAMVDPGQLELAILNLVINARDAMPGGGRLTITVADAEVDDNDAGPNAEIVPGTYVLVAVSDSGEGMPPEVLARAMEPFFTTKEVGKGSGLGLSMVYGFVRQSGGQVRIYSEVGIGTTVKLYLPRAVVTAEQAAPLRRFALPRGSERILLVEDSEDVLRFARSSLTDLGYQVASAGSGPAALELVDAGGEYDLLLTDVVLPGGMNGRELAEAIGRRRPGIRTLYMSGYPEDAIVHHGRLDPGVHHLQKPFRRAELARMVRLTLEG